MSNVMEKMKDLIEVDKKIKSLKSKIEGMEDHLYRIKEIKHKLVTIPKYKLSAQEINSIFN
jgi:hypothetical protein